MVNQLFNGKKNKSRFCGNNDIANPYSNLTPKFLLKFEYKASYDTDSNVSIIISAMFLNPRKRSKRPDAELTSRGINMISRYVISSRGCYMSGRSSQKVV